jgi:hypothetical protein
MERVPLKSSARENRPAAQAAPKLIFGKVMASRMATIHGFRVESYGKRLSPGFKRGLRRLAERGFDDAACVVVKTENGIHSGITHAGGRYVAPGNPYGTEVMRLMRDLGMEPPTPPFIVAPGEYTLYHEWGHHVDRSWSGHQQITFSYRWFSHFYKLSVRPSGIAKADGDVPLDNDEDQPIESWDIHAADALVAWWHVSSELFADLFEDWMRGEKKIGSDPCQPDSLNASTRAHPSVRVFLLPGVGPEDVRAKTYALFAAGIKSAPDLPPVRPDLFGQHTAEMIDRFRNVRNDMRKAQPTD